MAETQLRVALANDARITMDLVILHGMPVTLGTSSECTFVLRGLVPERHLLFETMTGRYVLNLVGVMDARVKRDGAIKDVATLRAEHLLISRKSARETLWTLPLFNADRGVVYIGGTGARVLFEFVAPITGRRPFSFLRRALGFGKP